MKTTRNRLRRCLLPAIGLLLAAFAHSGCTPHKAPAYRTTADCFRETSREIQAKPTLDCLTTLDDRCIPLAEFYDQCTALWPDCVMFRKFYHWPSKIIEMVAQTPSGPVTHKIRAYDNLLNTCDPNHEDPGRTHGDVAEFYDGQGQFIGLAVYMGKGLYVPLPYRP